MIKDFGSLFLAVCLLYGRISYKLSSKIYICIMYKYKNNTHHQSDQKMLNNNINVILRFKRVRNIQTTQPDFICIK